MSYYIKGKFNNSDYTFCSNQECKKRKNCARNIDRYIEYKDKLVSISLFNCEEVTNEKHR